MNKKLKCITLVDDNPHDNFFHEREIRKSALIVYVVARSSGKEALEYLESKVAPPPDLIFLDINMPGMNGWEFLEAYNRLDTASKGSEIIIMLTTSDNPDDMVKAKNWSNISDYITKPLTKELMNEIIQKYFSE